MFENEIEIFIDDNKLLGQRENSIVLYGSSTMKLWRADWIKRDLAPYEIINRGFGGSSAAHALEFLDRAVLPLDPKAMLYYEGPTDLRWGLTPEESFKSTKQVYERLKEYNPDLVWFSLLLHLAPHVSERHEKYEQLNAIYTEFCSQGGDRYAIDPNSFVYSDGTADHGMYMEDLAHFSEAGYKKLGQLVRRQFAKVLG